MRNSSLFRCFLIFFVFFSVLLITSDLAQLYTNKSLAFKNIFELKANKKDSSPLLTALLQDTEDKSVKDRANKVTSSFFKDEYGKRYESLSNQLRSRGVNADPFGVDASKSSPNRPLDPQNPNRAPRIPGISTDPRSSDIEDDTTSALLIDRTSLYLKYHNLMGRPQAHLLLEDVLKNRYIAEVKNQQEINENIETRNYKVAFVDDLLNVFFDPSAITPRRLLVQAKKEEVIRLDIYKKMPDSIEISSSGQDIALKIDVIAKLYDGDESDMLAVKQLFETCMGRPLLFMDSLKSKERSSVLQLDYPYYITTRDTLYIATPYFFKSDKRLAQAKEEINKKLPLKDKNTKKAEDKELIEIELLTQTANLIEVNYFLWMFVELYGDKLDGNTKDEVMKDNFNFFRTTLSEMVRDEAEARR